jgi:hypothetical protein
LDLLPSDFRGGFNTTTATIANRTNTYNTNFTSPIAPFSSSIKSTPKEELKSVVKRLISTDRSFLTWIQLQLYQIMPTPDNIDNPTPAEAAKMSSASKHSKRVKGGPGVAHPGAAGKKPDPPPQESPIRHAGSKRVQNRSPQVTPAKAKASSGVDDINRPDSSFDGNLTPLNLEEKIKVLEGKETLTDYQVMQLVTDPNWSGQLWDHKDVGRVLGEADASVLYAEEYYVFRGGELTPETELLCKRINLLKLRHHMAKRAMKCSNPTASTYHHSHGPFGFLASDSNPDSFDVINSAGKVVSSFAFSAFSLDTAEFPFDLDDTTTYETLCTVNSKTLVKSLRSLVKSGKEPFVSIIKASNGPFYFRSVGDGRLGLFSTAGQIANFEMAALRSSGTADESTKVPAESDNNAWKKPTKIAFGPNDERNFCATDKPSATANPFASLSDNNVGDEAAANEQPLPVSKPPTVSKQPTTSTKSKSPDEMLVDEFDAALNEEATKPAKDDTKVSSKKSRKKTKSSRTKSGDTAASWMEPTDYNSAEDEAFGSEDVSSAESVGNDSADTGIDSGEVSDLEKEEDATGASPGSDEESEYSEISDEDMEEQATPAPGKEGVVIGTKSSGLKIQPGGSLASSMQTEDTTLKEALRETGFGTRTADTEWTDEVSVGSDDSTAMPAQVNLANRPPPTPAMSTSGDSTQTDISGVTDPSYIIQPGSNVYLLSATINLQPNRKHKEVLLERLGLILEYISGIAHDVKILPKSSSPTGTALPPIKSKSDSHFPKQYGEFKLYGTCTNEWVLAQNPVDAQTLANRDENRLAQQKQSKKKGSRGRGKRASLRKSDDGGSNDNGPTALYVNFSISTQFQDPEELTRCLNIDLGTDIGVGVGLKSLQCWESRAEKVLLGVNSQLCPLGLQFALTRAFQRERRSMCQKNKLDTLKYYDKPIPQFKIYTKKLRPQRNLPEDERDSLSFNAYPGHLHFAFHMEASAEGWKELNPIIDEYTKSDRLTRDFGPNAFFLDLPVGRSGVDTNRRYHEACRIHMGSQLKETIMDTNHVQSWDHFVKVKMQEVEEIVDGVPTGRNLQPPRPYTRTNLLHELTDITINGTPVFHTAIVTELGPEAGISRVVVNCDPSNPYSPACRAFAKNTLPHLPMFFHHYLPKVKGFHESTNKRLLNCHYLDSAAMSEFSTWDGDLLKATPTLQTRRDRWFEEHQHLDVKRKSRRSSGGDSGPAFLGENPVEVLTDERRKILIGQLRLDPKKTGADILDADGHASVLTGHDGQSVNSFASAQNSTNAMKQAKDLALQLALERRAKADIAAQQAKMAAELEQLRALIQRGSPNLGGSGPSSSEVDRGGEEPRA